MVVFGWVIIKLMDRPDNKPCDWAIMLAVWMMPFLTVPLGIASLPLSFLPLLALGARLLWRLRNLEELSRLRAGALAVA